MHKKFCAWLMALCLVVGGMGPLSLARAEGASQGAVGDGGAAPLSVSASADRRYAMAHRDDVQLYVQVTGGQAPYQVALQVTGAQKMQKCVTLAAAGGQTFTCSPDRFGTLRMAVTVTDSAGCTASASASVPVAVDVQDHPDVWAESVQGAWLNGDWQHDLVAVAQTQVGYEENKRNFMIDENGVRHNYTRYGDWYGSVYGEWCAMFVSFCLHFAGVPESGVPREGGCTRWKNLLMDRAAYIAAEEHVPVPGDLIFLAWDGEDNPDHVGIVEQVFDGRVCTIEGNTQGRVQRHEYALDDSAILAYGSLQTLMEQANVD